MKLLTLIVCLLLCIGCGYKPASYYAGRAIGEKIFTDVIIPITDPQSGPALIDAINEAIVAKFGKKLSSRDDADTTLIIKNGHYSFDSLQKDEYGFIIMYRCRVNMQVLVNNEKINNKTFTISGSYDFMIEPNSILSDTVKNNAAREAASRAFDNLIANILFLGKS